MATFLIGDACSFDRAIFTGMHSERQTNTGLSAQDVWRINPRLTLNYALRWDYFTPVTSPYKGGLPNFDPATGDILLAGLDKMSSSANVSTPLPDRYAAGHHPTQSLPERLPHQPAAPDSRTTNPACFGPSPLATLRPFQWDMSATRERIKLPT